MIDFLGRRRECAQLRRNREPEHLDEDHDWRRLECSRIAAEESELRRRHSADASAMRWFDAQPITAPDRQPRMSRGLRPVQRLKAREKAVGSEKPTR